MRRFDELMAKDKLFQSIIHQNSRKYAIESSKIAGGGEVAVPGDADAPRGAIRLRHALLTPSR